MIPIPITHPDGSQIAFYSFRDGNREIYTMDADGSNQTRITNHTAWDYSPTWSPDGSQLSFVSMRDGNEEIYRMNANGSSLIRLTNHSSSDGLPAWSPYLVIPEPNTALLIGLGLSALAVRRENR